MSDPISHNQTYELITATITSLFGAERRRLNTNIQNLIKKNEVYFDLPSDGFTYLGENYTKEDLPVGKKNLLQLHVNLHDNIIKHLDDTKTITQDAEVISQLLYRLLSRVETQEDIRNALPECIKDVLIPELQSTPRIKDPTEYLDHPRDLKLYNKIIPKVEFYATARLLY